MDEIAISKKLRKNLFFAWAFVMPLIVINGYFGRLFSPMIAWQIDDYWCTPPAEGIGSHCFGDFSDIYSRNPSDPWNWVAPMAHTPMPLLIHGSFRALGEFTDQKKLVLILWLSFQTLCILTPILFVGVKQKWKNFAQDFLILGFATLPALFALDRGNNLVSALPVLVVVMWAFKNNQYSLLIGGIVVATMLRPQLGVLFLLFIPVHNLRAVTSTFLWMARALAISFLLHPGDRFNNFTSWAFRSIDYQDYGDPYLVHSDVSFARSFAIAVQLLQRLNISIPTWIQDIPYELSIQYLAPLLCALAVLLWLRGGRIAKEMQLLLVIILAISIPQTSSGYYLIYLYPVFAMLLISENNANNFISPNLIGSKKIKRFGYLLFSMASVFSLVPLTIPLSLVLPQKQFEGVSLTQGLASFVWHIFVGFLVLIMLLPKRCFDQIITDDDTRLVKTG
jgi:hypothetical protein